MRKRNAWVRGLPIAKKPKKKSSFMPTTTGTIDRPAVSVNNRGLLQWPQVSSTELARNLSICLTGTGPVNRSILIARIEGAGHVVTQNANRADMLVRSSNGTGLTSKLNTAQMRGILIMNYERFLELL